MYFSDNSPLMQRLPSSRGTIPAYLLATSMLFSACTMMPPEDERMHAAQIGSAVLPMAKAALEAGQLETAWRLYRRLLEVDADSVDARIGLGDVALARQAPSQAANWYLAAVGHTDTVEQRHAALLAHGRAALATGDLQAARASFGRLADPAENASNADAAWGFNGVGIVSLLEGRPREAVASMEQAVLRLPNEGKFHGNLTRALKLASRHGPADAVDTASTTTEEISVAEAQTQIQTTPGSSDEPFRIGSMPAHEPVAERTEGSFPIKDAEPAAGHPSGADVDVPLPATETPDPVEPPLDPGDLEPPAAPLEDSDVFTNTIAAATPDAPAVTSPEPEAAQPEQRNVSAQETANESTEREALEPAKAEGTKPSVSFPGAFLVRLETGEFLQVGAFAQKENAENSRSRILEVARLPVRIDPSDSAGKSLYRVRVGPISSRETLSELALTLGVDRARLGFSTGRNDPSDQKEDDSPANDTVTGTVAKGREPPPRKSRETPIHVVENGAGFVQVGAYANHDAAIAIASKLRGMTEHPVTLSELAQGGDPTIYRVRVGPVDADSRPDLLRRIAAR